MKVVALKIKSSLNNKYMQEKVNKMNIQDQQLIEKGYLDVVYNHQELERINNLYQRWKEFLLLDQGIREKLSYLNDKSMGAGYEVKRDGSDKNTLDYKDDLHVTWEYVNSGRMDHSEFANLKRAIIEILNQSVVIINKQLPIMFGRKSLEADNQLTQKDLFLRMLWYPDQNNEILATEHLDKGLCTLHLLENRPGLQIMPFSKDKEDLKWVDITVSDRGILFPGFQGQYFSDNKIKALPHRVVSKPVYNYTQGQSTSGQVGNERFSIVVFCNLPKVDPYNKGRYGRLQDLPVGSNYYMSDEEVKARFAKD